MSIALDAFIVVPRKGLEPPLPCGKRILSPPRLPFRHLGLPMLPRLIIQLELVDSVCSRPPEGDPREARVSAIKRGGPVPDALRDA